MLKSENKTKKKLFKDFSAFVLHTYLHPLQGAAVTGVPFRSQREAVEPLSCKMKAPERGAKMY